ncbi:MAG: hybrid sensor histidine kinase/response regulator [Planctomycetota bacterium]|jgi:two-component system sensor histidine kinase/response regulator|nr:hybrid sensor histidine kinase/response regulator [Planctomycetota bacterium]
MDEANRGARLLIVDDTLKNIQVLGTLLRKEEFQINVAQNGQQALDVVAKVKPDLILLDVMMPDMDGFECCQHLKDDPETSEIPVIFLTAKVETEDIVKGFEIGAVDYVTKPFNPTELMVRVNTHLTISRLHREVAEKYDALQKAEGARDGLSHMIVHDMNNPLGALKGFADLLLMQVEMDTYDKDMFQQYLGFVSGSGQQLLTMVQGILDVSKMEAEQLDVRLVAANVAEIASSVVQGSMFQARQAEISVELEKDADDIQAMADIELLPRILQNLLGNAFKYAGSGNTVTVRAKQGDEIVLQVADTGPGIPEEARERIFDKFYQSESVGQRRGVGLGLAFCKMAAEGQEGRIWVESKEGEGTTFNVALKPA